MKALVTGSVGFIGSHIVENLLKRGDEVIGYDNMSRGPFNYRILKELPKHSLIVGDILDFEKVKKVMNGVDVVFHMAALPSHRLALEHPYEYGMIDLQGTLNVLEAARLQKKKPLILFASSNKVYGKQECPWREDKLPQPEGPYAVSKWASEKLCEMYNKYYDIPIVIVRYHHVAGKRSNPELALSVFTDNVLKHQPPIVHGRFEKDESFTPCSADYTHIDDAVRATLLAVDKYKDFQIFNIANKKLTSVQYIAEYVRDQLDPTLPIGSCPMLPHETLMHHSDVSKAEKKLGFVAEKPIEEAFDDYIEWVENE